MVEAPDKGIPPDHIAQPITRTSRSKLKSQRSIDLELLGMQIARYRTNAGLSRKDLAKKAGVSRDTVIRVECGEMPSVTTLYRFSKALKRTIRIKAN
jgi:DNA-binding XRE family transcriptional regulator